VRSNSEWIVKPASFSDPAGVLDEAFVAAFLAQSGGYKTNPGSTFSFQLIQAASISAGGQITFTLSDPTGRVPDLPVTIYGYNCGINGVAVKRQVGANDYLTHMYGDKCWMVQNSREGTPSATYWGTLSDRVNGYYYDFANKETQCAGNWRLPTQAEAEEMVLIARTDPERLGKWWYGEMGVEHGAFAGYHDTAWQYWGSYGRWWVITESYRFIRGSKDGTGEKFVVTSAGTNMSTFRHSVRCVYNN
jgi:hypothetical protein